jgi:LysR family glycine cleavage system transcriptional activator
MTAFRRLPPLNGLRAFEAAARHLSFTRAAAELNVTQAAISHQIRMLEERLAVKLFVRRNRTVLLSEAGQAYLPALRDAFDMIDQATDRLLRRDEGGRLVISSTASFATKWLVPRLGAFQTLHPEIEVQLSTSFELVDFQRDAVDAAIRFGLGKWPGLFVERLFSQDLFPVCAPSMVKGKTGLKQPADLAHATLLHTTTARDDWRLWLTAAGVKGVDPARGPVFDQLFTALQAAIDGVGVALGHTQMVERDIAAGRLVQPFDLTLPIEAAYYFVCPPAALKRRNVKAFHDWMLALTPNAAS